MIRSLITNRFPHFWSSLKRWRRAVLNLRSSRRVFTNIYHDNSWGDVESRSGPGSNLESTAVIRKLLPEFLRRTSAKSILDLPCGDLHWIKTVDLGNIQYTGADVVPEIIDSNRKQFGGSIKQFQVIDLIKDELPAADVLLCRDCLIHLPNCVSQTVITRICKSSFKYLITTTFVDIDENIDIELGGFRAINLEKSPFLLPPPLELHLEGGHEGKSVAIWKLSDLRQHLQDSQQTRVFKGCK